MLLTDMGKSIDLSEVQFSKVLLLICWIFVGSEIDSREVQLAKALLPISATSVHLCRVCNDALVLYELYTILRSESCRLTCCSD